MCWCYIRDRRWLPSKRGVINTVSMSLMTELQALTISSPSMLDFLPDKVKVFRVFSETLKSCLSEYLLCACFMGTCVHCDDLAGFFLSFTWQPLVNLAWTPAVFFSDNLLCCCSKSSHVVTQRFHFMLIANSVFLNCPFLKDLQPKFFYVKIHRSHKHEWMESEGEINRLFKTKTLIPMQWRHFSTPPLDYSE